VPGIADQRRRADAPARNELVTGDDLVPDDAQGRADNAQRDMAGGAVLQQFPEALVPGERRAGPDDDRDSCPGQVLGPVQAIGVPPGRPFRDSRNPRNATALVDTSDRLWIASPSSPTEPVRTASSSSAMPVAASPIALTAIARLASRRSGASSRVAGSGNAAAGSRRPAVLRIPP